MNGRIRLAFLLLVLAQVCHSVEDYRFHLYDRLAPARFASAMFDDDRAAGFLLLHCALVAFGLWCWAVPVLRDWRPARTLAWVWAAVGVANGIGDIGLAIASGGYFPGLATAPLLVGASALLLRSLSRQPAAAR